MKSVVLALVGFLLVGIVATEALAFPTRGAAIRQGQRSGLRQAAQVQAFGGQRVLVAPRSVFVPQRVLVQPRVFVQPHVVSPFVVQPHRFIVPQGVLIVP